MRARFRKWLYWPRAVQPCLCATACNRFRPTGDDGIAHAILVTSGITFSATCQHISSDYVSDLVITPSLNGTFHINARESLDFTLCDESDLTEIATWTGNVHASPVCDPPSTPGSGTVKVGVGCDTTGRHYVQIQLCGDAVGDIANLELLSVDHETGVHTDGVSTIKTDPAYHVYCPKHEQYQIVDYADGDLVACSGCTGSAANTFNGRFKNEDFIQNVCTWDVQQYIDGDSTLSINGKALDVFQTKITLIDAGLGTCRYRLTIWCSGALVWEGEKNPGGCDPRGTYLRTGGCDTTPSLEVEYV